MNEYLVELQMSPMVNSCLHTYMHMPVYIHGYMPVYIHVYMLRFNPKWDMHWLRTKQNREWFASKACSQNSGFSFGSFKYISAIM